MTSIRREFEWDLIISPKVALFDLQLRDLWRYRDLLGLFVRRDFVAQYQQTVLGPLWHLIQPLLTTLMLLLVFGHIANIPTGAVNPPLLFYMSGIAIWNYFASCVTNTANTFVSNAAIFGKVYFPRLVMPLSIVISNGIRFGIQFLLLLSFMAFFAIDGYHIGVTWHVVFLPLLVLLVAGIGLGLGITVSALTTKYRDFGTLVTFAIQLGMYVTPVAYPLAYVRQKKLGWIIDINPLTPVVEAFRYSLFGKGTFSSWSLGYSALVMVIILLSGILLFNRVERQFMDTV
jgi:lipopolysaccharide transport system permease protein